MFTASPSTIQSVSEKSRAPAPRRSTVRHKSISDPAKEERQRNDTLLKKRATTCYVNKKFPKLGQFIASTQFASVIGVLILINCATIGLETHSCPPSDSPRFKGSGRVSEGCPDVFLKVSENIFTFIFVCEFFLRGYVLGWDYYKSASNLFDAFLVWITGVLLTWILQPIGQDASQMRIFSVLRAFRLLRVARVVKSNPEFKEMWLLLKGLADSIQTLFWTIVVLLFVNFIFGIFALITIGDSSGYDDLDEPYFDGLDNCLFTLLQVITGDGWASAIARPVISVTPAMWIFFTLYVAVGMLVLLNLITAVIVDNAMAISKQDEENMLAELNEQKKQEFDKLQSMFKTLDADGSGEIDAEEFNKAYEEHPEIQDKFVLLGFEADEVPHLFNDLDNGDGSLSLEEFVGGLRAMQGVAQGKDMVKIKTLVERMFKKIDIGSGSQSVNSFGKSKSKTFTNLDDSAKPARKTQSIRSRVTFIEDENNEDKIVQSHDHSNNQILSSQPKGNKPQTGTVIGMDESVLDDKLQDFLTRVNQILSSQPKENHLRDDLKQPQTTTVVGMDEAVLDGKLQGHLKRVQDMLGDHLKHIETRLGHQAHLKRVQDMLGDHLKHIETRLGQIYDEKLSVGPRLVAIGSETMTAGMVAIGAEHLPSPPRAVSRSHSPPSTSPGPPRYPSGKPGSAPGWRSHQAGHLPQNGSTPGPPRYPNGKPGSAPGGQRSRLPHNTSNQENGAENWPSPPRAVSPDRCHPPNGSPPGPTRYPPGAKPGSAPGSQRARLPHTTGPVTGILDDSEIRDDMILE